MILEISIYGVWYLPNKYCRYYWSKDRSLSVNNTEIIFVASPTDIVIKGKNEQSFIEVINYENITNKRWN